MVPDGLTKPTEFCCALVLFAELEGTMSSHLQKVSGSMLVTSI